MRIVVRSPDLRAARNAQTLLAAAGLEAMVAPAGLAAPEGEDVLIVPGSTKLDAPGRPPLVVLCGLLREAPPPIGLESRGAFTGAIALDAPPRLLAAQISAFIRDGVAQEERTRRRATAAELGLAAPKPLEHKKLKAVYIGAPSPKFLRLETALSQHGGLVTAAFSSFTGFDHLHDEAFDAVVLNGAQDPGTAISLCAALRRNAGLYHLPTLVITAPGDEATAKAAIERGASAVTALNESAGPGLGWLFEAIRRERKRKVAEHELRALRDIMGDSRTGLFRRAPFEMHLARLADDHHANGRPLGLAALRVLPAHGARVPSEEIWKRGFTEIASLAGRLARDADSGATIGGDVIALALPAADLKSARRAAERVASVAECTAFASGENSSGPLVFEQSCVELQPGESGMGLLARALRAIELESIPGAAAD